MSPALPGERRRTSGKYTSCLREQAYLFFLQAVLNNVLGLPQILFCNQRSKNNKKFLHVLYDVTFLRGQLTSRRLDHDEPSVEAM
jgi:hypothetical protein